MKKFFELSVTSRKSVKGETILSAEARSSTDEKLGQLDINVLNEETSKGVFFKYTPTQGCDTKSKISELKITEIPGHDIHENLNTLAEAIRDVILKKADGDFSTKLILSMMVSEYIKPDTGKIIIPYELIPDGFEVTNKLITDYVGDEWIGVEVKVSPEVADKVKNLSDLPTSLNLS